METCNQLPDLPFTQLALASEGRKRAVGSGAEAGKGTRSSRSSRRYGCHRCALSHCGGAPGASDLYLHAGQRPAVAHQRRSCNLIDECRSARTALGTGGLLDALRRRCRPRRDFDGSLRRFRWAAFSRESLPLARPARRGAAADQDGGSGARLPRRAGRSPRLVAGSSGPTGLILVTGPTGSGKSTTVAACLDWLNQHRAYHIVTIEDPVEYLFQSASSLFTQREVGTDTPSFAEGCAARCGKARTSSCWAKSATAPRRSPPWRRRKRAISFSPRCTAPTCSTRWSGSRVSSRCGEREGVQQVLAQQLIGILCQRLVPAQAGGVALVVEHFENQAVTRKWILEGKFRELADHVARGDNPGNVTFLQSLVALVQSERIPRRRRMQAASNPQELHRRLRGINSSSMQAYSSRT